MKLEQWPYIYTFLNILVKKFGSDGKHVIDIGAFIGSMVTRMAPEFPDKVFHAIEPYSPNYSVLKDNVGSHINIVLHKLIISGKNGVLNIFADTDELTQSPSLEKQFIQSKEKLCIKEQVQTVTLGQFCEDNKINDIALLHMNCEGGEYHIFEDKTSRWVFDKTNVIYLALHGKNEPFIGMEYTKKKKAINKFLMSKNFKMLYGDDLEKVKQFPYGHIIQIWSK